MATSIGSGLGASLGIGKESTYGTAVAPTKFTEFESESVTWKPNRTRGKSIYNGGLLPRATQRSTTSSTVEGDVVTPVYTAGMGQWLGLICGTLGITPVQQGSSAAYMQTHTLANNYGQSATVQIGRPTMDGTVNPYTYSGCTLTKAVFEAKVDEPLRATFSIDGQKVSESPSYTTPTYTTPNAPFFWQQGSYTMGTLGSEALVEGVTSFTLTIERNLNTSAYYLDGTGLKAQPVMSDYLTITGEVETNFTSKAAFADIFYNDTPQSVIVPFVGSNIASTYNHNITFKMPHCRFDSEPPQVAGLDIIQPKMTFDVEFDDTDAPFQILYTSTDITI